VPALSSINAMDGPAFVACLGGVFEHSPWVAERASARRPFASVDALHAAMMAVVRAAPRETQLALLRAHPELAGREALTGTMTRDSTSEQGRLGLDALDPAELARLAELNRTYRERFGFPCIIALRSHATRASVIASFERRLANDPATEIGNALGEVGVITRGRLDKLLSGE
jgi:2-oxo-4-hydroxy-4-carboxy-5-ureidoimidazoline decarboxylase